MSGTITRHRVDTLFPTLAGLFTVSPYDPKTQRVVTRSWTKIVTGQ